MGKLAGLKKAINQARRRVYQGSPHKHSGKLDADKIGTGEGAQAYGYGHYVAESEDVAKNYKKSTGHLYELDLNESAIDNMLDWDAPLSEQPIYSDVKKMAAEYKAQGKKPDQVAKLTSLMNANKNMTGGNFYHNLLSKHGGSQEAVSAWLKETGIPGIKYFDGQSRAGAEGTRNFVIFPGAEDQIKAISRNKELLGIGGAAVLGGAALTPEDAMAAELDAIALQGAGGWQQKSAKRRSKWAQFKESIAEPAATVATGLASLPVQGLAGIGALAQGYGIDDAVGAMGRAGEAMTYTPRSEAGMESLQNVAEAADILGNSPPAKFYMDHINQGADWAADNIHPAAGAALKTLPEVVF